MKFILYKNLILIKNKRTVQCFVGTTRSSFLNLIWRNISIFVTFSCFLIKKNYPNVYFTNLVDNCFRKNGTRLHGSRNVKITIFMRCTISEFFPDFLLKITNKNHIFLLFSMKEIFLIVNFNCTYYFRSSQIFMHSWIEFNKTFTTALRRIEYQHPAHLYIRLIQGVNDVYLTFLFNNKVKQTHNNWITWITRCIRENIFLHCFYFYTEWQRGFKQLQRGKLNRRNWNLSWFTFCTWYKINENHRYYDWYVLKF